MIDGRLSLTTPEGIRLRLTPAGPGARALAWMLDLLIYAGFMIVVSIFLSGTRVGQGVLMIIGFVSYWGYPVICEVYFAGRTIGKRALGIQVLRTDGLAVGWRESALRNLLLVADFMPVMYATGLICMISNTHFRRIGDIAANTVVVYHEKAVQRPKLATVAALPPPFPLTPEQQRSLIDLLERESILPRARLLELASLAEPLTGAKEELSLQRLRAIVAGINQ